jgi:putative ABC transport system substrate-binding protein
MKIQEAKRRKSYILSTLMCSLFLMSGPSFSAEVKKEVIKTIAITQIVSHPSLNEAKAGILARLKAEGFEVGKNLKVIEEHAHGNIATQNLIAKKFVGMKDVDLIIPISTPSALAVKSAAKGSGKAIVFSSVSDPVGAGLVADLKIPDATITGAHDAPAVKEAQDLMKHFVPQLKTIGVLFNSGEANSVRSMEALNGILDSKLKIQTRTVSNSNLVADATRSIIGKVEAIYIPNDNTVFSAIPKLVQIANEHKLPTFTSDPDSVKSGILAAYGYSQYEVGQTAGALAATILRGDNLGKLHVRSPEKADVYINRKTAKLLGLKVPDQFQGNKVTIIE